MTLARQPDFQIFTGLLKAAQSPDGRMRLHGVASSNTRDLHGDIMTLTALQDMEKAANNNLTIFLNHSYNVPEDVAGSVEMAQLHARESDANGQIYDLDFDVVIDEANPRAVQTWNSIQKGTKLGISIGAMIPDGGAKREKAGGFQIEHVNLLEGSFVGIPAQPRSWVEYAVKSLSGTGKNEWFETDEMGSGATAYTTYLWNGSVPTITAAARVCPTCGGTKGSPEGNCDASFHTKAAMCPGCGGGKDSPKGDCSDHYHMKEIEPALQLSHGELPDSAFACISPGGKRVDGKTAPLSLRHYPHHTASGGVDPGLLRSALSRIADPKNEQCGKAHLEAHAKSLGMGDREKALDDFFIAALEAEAEIDVHHFLRAADTESDAPLQRQDFEHTHGHAHSHGGQHGHDDGEMNHDHDHGHIHEHAHHHGDAGDHPHDEANNHPDHNHDHEGASEKDHAHQDLQSDDDTDKQGPGGAEKGLTKGRVTIIVDTDEGVSAPASQEARSSGPGAEDGLADETANGDDERLGDSVTRGMEPVVDLLRTATRELVEVRQSLTNALIAKAAAEKDRDQAIADRSRVLTETKRLIDRIADSPLVRRAVVRDAQEDLSRFSAIYSDDFLKMLESKHD